MTTFQIHRPHSLGLEPARHLARHWAEAAQQKHQMNCTVCEEEAGNRVDFVRAGDAGNGSLRIASTGYDESSKVENATRDALIYLNAFYLADIQLNRASTDEPEFCDNALVGDSQLSRLVFGVSNNQENQPDTKHRK